MLLTPIYLLIYLAQPTPKVEPPISISVASVVQATRHITSVKVEVRNLTAKSVAFASNPNSLAVSFCDNQKRLIEDLNDKRDINLAQTTFRDLITLAPRKAMTLNLPIRTKMQHRVPSGEYWVYIALRPLSSVSLESIKSSGNFAKLRSRLYTGKAISKPIAIRLGHLTE